MSHTISRTSRMVMLTTLLAAPLSAQLPDAKKIIDQSIAAVGGADAIRKSTSYHLTGKLDAPAQGISGTVESWNSGGKLLTVIEIPGIGSIRSGYDGTVGWQIHPAFGANVMTGRQLDQLKQQGDPTAALTPEKYFKSRETVEKTTFDGKEAYKVKLVLHNGEEYFELYDVTSGLNIGSIRNTESPMGPIETTSTVVEFKKFGDLLMPVKIKQGAMGIENIITISNVDYAAVPATTFELPKEIKALTAK
ncbi:MAG: hypothetical protein ACREMA_06780 [Longimicrobiales bacterium]